MCASDGRSALGQPDDENAANDCDEIRSAYADGLLAEAIVRRGASAQQEKPGTATSGLAILQSTGGAFGERRTVTGVDRRISQLLLDMRT